jgi:hypothetical protein
MVIHFAGLDSNVRRYILKTPKKTRKAHSCWNAPPATR